MKTSIKDFIFCILVLSVTACHPGESSGREDTKAVPAIKDTMPVVNPGQFDSGSIIKTPPTNDHNALIPDTSIKTK